MRHTRGWSASAWNNRAGGLDHRHAIGTEIDALLDSSGGYDAPRSDDRRSAACSRITEDAGHALDARLARMSESELRCWLGPGLTRLREDRRESSRLPRSDTRSRGER